MKSKILKIVTVAMLLMTLTMTNFVFVGSSLISYAAGSIATNNQNVEFDAYFKDAEGRAITSLNTFFDNSELYLYLQVNVRKEGYFNGSVVLDKANFILKETDSPYINRIEGNTIALNQINAGATVEMKIRIEPVKNEIFDAGLLDVSSKLNISGIYRDSSERDINIKATREVKLQLVEENNSENALNNMEVITNKIVKIDGTEKRVVQISLDLGLKENNYPIKEINEKIVVPIVDGQKPEILEVMNLNNMTSYDYNYDGQNVTFVLKNESNNDGKIIWRTQGNENIILTCVYDKDVKLDNLQVVSEEKVTLYDLKEISTNSNITLNGEDKDSIIEVISKNAENSIYKGKLNSGIDRQYESLTDLKINLAEVAEYVSIKENKSTFIINDAENEANVYYEKTIISKEQFNKIFGNDGSIVVFNENDEEIAKITNSDEIDENGNIIIDYAGKDVKSIRIETTSPVTEGTLQFRHVKVIKASDKEVVKNSNILNTMISAEYNMKNSENYSDGIAKEARAQLNLENAKTEARLELNKETLSTVISNNIEMKVVLKSNSEEYDLYKNPELTIVLPEQVESININSIDIVYENELKIRNYEVNGRTLKIYFEGVQTQYKELAIEGANIIINANVVVNKKAATKDDEVKLIYSNENSEGGEATEPIKVVAPKDITAINSIKDLSIETIGQEEVKKVMIERGKEARELESQIEIINNNSDAVKDVKVIGSFPTDNKSNNMKVEILDGINILEGQNAKVYYSENEDATEDLADSQNRWTETVNANSKKYLIVADGIESQSSIQGTYKMGVPANLEYNQNAKTSYNVKYANSVTGVNSELNSTEIEMQTGIGPKVETKISALVDGNEAKESVKNGEVIKYKIEISNVGTEGVSSATVKADVPEGTTLIQPQDNYEYSGASYYKELDSKTYETTIENLKAGEVIYKEYEVKVNKGVQAGTKLVNKAEVKYGDVTKESNTIENTTAEGKLSVVVKRVTDRNIDLYTAGTVQYFAIVENISNEKQENIKVKTNLQENLEVRRLTLMTGMAKDQNMDDEIYRANSIDNLESQPKEITEEELTNRTSPDDNIKSEELQYDNEIDIGALESGEVKVLSYDMAINKAENTSDKIHFSVSVKDASDEYKSNGWTDDVKDFTVNLNMTSNTENKYVKSGDVIEYTITIQNTSTVRTEGLVIKDEIPSQLSVNKVTIDGEEEKELQDNNKLEISCDVAANSTMTIKIETSVNYSESRDSAEAITNVAYAELYGEKIATTSEMSHIIQANDGSTSPNGNNDVPNNDIAQGTRTITGIAWYDENANGKKDNNEQTLSNIKVRLLNTKTNNLVKDSNGTTLEAVTNENGVYILDKIGNGNYIVIFDYDKAQYGLTKYKVDGISENENSNAMMNELTIGSEKQQVASTDIIQISDNNISDINIGFIKLQNFDLKLDKYVSKILIQTSAGTTVREYNNETMAKVELDAKQVNGATVIIEYNIAVTNNGEVEGYAKKVVDYMPSDLKFSSELNKDWYQSGDVLYTTSLSNEKIAAGETKNLKLTLTKSMTEDNVGLINNRAEIAEAYNELGIEDSNSTPGNNARGENDMGSADVILSIRTGGVVYISIAIVLIIALGVTSVVIIRKKNYKEND